MPDRLQEICQKNGWKFSWMKDERARLEKDSRQRLSGEAWRERLQALAEKSTPDAEKPVPDGFCIKGCGREIAKGVTKSGKSFTTCCRGCAMGLGHDEKCWGHAKKHTESERRSPMVVTPGLCRMGCGRRVAASKEGRRFDTCCKGCAC